MEREELLRKVNEIEWYHSIDLGGGITTPGIVPKKLQEFKSKGIPEDLTGMSVLDIGAWDGYYSFLAESRGASRVLAIDSFPFRKKGSQGGMERYRAQSRRGFYLAKEALNSRVEFRELDVFELDKLKEDFDVVFFFELHHHLWDPILGIKLATDKCRKLFLIEGSMLTTSRGIIVWDDERTQDKTKAWRVSYGFLDRLIRSRGFKRPVAAYNVKESIFSLGPFTSDSDLLFVLGTSRMFLRFWRKS